MNRLSIYNRVLRILNTNSTATPQSDFNNDIDEATKMRAMRILLLGGYKFISQTHAYQDFLSITGLSAGDSGFNGEYSLPTDLLDVERIEVTYDSTNWYVLSRENGRIYDISQGSTSEQHQTTIQNNNDESDPVAFFLRGSLYIRPLNDGTTQTNGLHLFYSPRQAVVDGDSDTPEFEENLHQALIYDCAEFELIAHPEKYNQEIERRILRKKAEVDKSFDNFYRTRLKVLTTIRPQFESFN